LNTLENTVMLHPLSAFVAINLTTALALLSSGAVQAQTSGSVGSAQRAPVTDSTLSTEATSPLPFSQLSQLSQRRQSSFPDVSETSWASDAIVFLSENYGCIKGFPDGTYRGDDPLTRNAFAAGMSACFQAYNETVQQQMGQFVTRDDLAVLFQVLSEIFDANQLQNAPPIPGPDSTLPPR
jgi:hypothetical protein